MPLSLNIDVATLELKRASVPRMEVVFKATFLNKDVERYMLGIINEVRFVDVDKTKFVNGTLTVSIRRGIKGNWQLPSHLNDVAEDILNSVKRARRTVVRARSAINLTAPEEPISVSTDKAYTNVAPLARNNANKRRRHRRSTSGTNRRTQ